MNQRRGCLPRPPDGDCAIVYGQACGRYGVALFPSGCWLPAGRHWWRGSTGYNFRWSSLASRLLRGTSQLRGQLCLTQICCETWIIEQHERRANNTVSLILVSVWVRGPVPASGPELVECADFVHHVQRGDLVGLGERWVVEHRIDQILDRSAAPHYRLADVHEFGGVGAEDVDTE